jgi:endonuclease YncB( thermonuclease family)
MPHILNRFPRIARMLRIFLATALMVGMAALVWMMSPSAGHKLHTDATTLYAVDGDSIGLGRAEGAPTLRLRGIDAPEFAQQCQRADTSDYPCGAAARDALAAILSQGGVECSSAATDAYHRALSTCKTRLTDDIGAALVRSGHAISGTARADDSWDDGGPYLLEQAQAQKERSGLWQGQFDRPGDWRVNHPR